MPEKRPSMNGFWDFLTGHEQCGWGEEWFDQVNARGETTGGWCTQGEEEIRHNCPQGTKYFDDANACFCPPTTRWSQESKTCLCPEGSAYSEEAKRCVQGLAYEAGKSSPWLPWVIGGALLLGAGYLATSSRGTARSNRRY